MEVSKLPKSVQKHLADTTPRQVRGRIFYEITFHHGTKVKRRKLRIYGISQHGRLVLQGGIYGPYAVPVSDIVSMKRAPR